MAAGRIYPRVIYRRASPNHHPRAGRVPTVIVVHSTEGRNIPGSQDLHGVSDWLSNPAAKASSHVVTDGDGTSSRLVADTEAAWTCAFFNAISLNIEQVGIAATEGWRDRELRETARWIAYWSKKYGIPIRKGRVVGGSVARTGVLRHSDLGSLGGDHHDPGPHYDLAKCLRYARQYRRAMK